MNETTAELLDKQITDIRIKLMQNANKEEMDRLLYDLQITVFKQIK